MNRDAPEATSPAAGVPHAVTGVAALLPHATGRVCSICVMDESNPALAFDANGQCNACRDAFARMPHEWHRGTDGARRLEALAAKLKAAGHGKRYDVMLGLSGGIDSAYLAHVAVRKLGLRALAVHVDGGWNSEPATRNIESLVRGLDLDLHTHVVEWQEMRDLQVAFLRASVLNQDIPQDHAFFATLYRTAVKFGIRDFLSGVNFTTECVNPPGWGYPSLDGHHARAIHRRFGTVPVHAYPFMDLPEFLWLTRVRRQLTIHRPLNDLDYDKEAARGELTREYGWRDYGGKHAESRFTKFYQEIYLPRKFGFDKRRLHLSSLIVSGQATRAEALAELATPIAEPRQVRRDIRFVAKKLGLAPADLEALIDSPPVSHLAYPNRQAAFARLSGLKSWARRVVRRRRGAAAGSTDRESMERAG
jgi:N-acetyl sugar amidotransferase